jgi:CheY-like chemotaxis protein
MLDQKLESTPNPGLRPARVLVVDDELAFCDVVCEILIACGYVATAANGVPEAMGVIAHERPDVILSDIMMPDVDGLQFISGLRRDPRFMQIPVLVVSAKASNGDREAALAAGASAFLAKPFSAHELETHIADLLQL